MGWFNKIRGILFEEEEEEIPTYPKKQKEEKVPKREVREDITEEIPVRQVPVVEDNESGLDAIREQENSKRRIIRRDDDFGVDDIDEVPGSAATMPKFKEDYEVPVKIKERKPIFQNFDEEEFDRLNSHIVANEKKVERTPHEDLSMNVARKANNNFSSTTTTGNKNNYRDPSRYKLDPVGGKKPFTPSPVISPVYGILNKNYKSDDIVDKKDGIKREIVKPINRQEIGSVNEEKEVEVEISIDSIRDKAYGAIDEMEKEAIAKIVNENKIDKENEIELPFVKDEVVETIPEEHEIPNDDLDIEEVIASQMEEVTPTEEVEKKPRRKVLDDVEKTSTLQILDDIEKELNSINPEKEKSHEDDSKDEPGDLTLENDLFNLIDSMYTEDEKGEEEDD